ncbi:MAG: acyl-ACP--UDP-N-acetylglucosamine O-acyltransferase [Saprospiraceae bacterium]|nr:acyl-ACP--UDP-N-acetylglucosamine O-acyltransferase [Saprospiraceae bacterium]MCB0542037.1 acyl-ACP--UDP-N-acetylglucosamine O-acyltransferase [Saprospiraceae bacterium]MCB0575481.1 acyl-ACP--UDP-N-acetylglucosamine O-acyltransferase [Saprospiraceae bacterium]MCB9305632.1 acyl-ACP--UDP-N-acetylglucosamine O-acyltransferase [Lewinellaceae bacterium]MCB9354123.1 acyl-ACP--UDP-N-acetylglucosamine O-acyltransferase [Lewinellaceae bacterium]
MSYSNGLRVIHPNAKIGKNVNIGPFTVIEEDVVIGDNCTIDSNVTIMNGARIGEKCHIFPGAVVSAIPQDLKYKGEKTTLELGNGCIVRECCTLNRGTINPEHAADGRTIIGDNCLLMAYVHVAHDCHISRGSILANNVTLAGHITVGEFARLGGMVAVHQFVRIGSNVMIGGGSLVRKDVPPYVTAAREPLSYAGINSEGLRRAKFTAADMHHIENIYRVLFVRGLSTRKALRIIEEEIMPSAYRDEILTFVRSAKRGLMKGFRTMSGSGKVAEPVLD